MPSEAWPAFSAEAERGKRGERGRKTRENSRTTGFLAGCRGSTQAGFSHPSIAHVSGNSQLPCRQPGIPRASGTDPLAQKQRSSESLPNCAINKSARLNKTCANSIVGFVVNGSSRRCVVMTANVVLRAEEIHAASRFNGGSSLSQRKTRSAGPPRSRRRPSAQKLLKSSCLPGRQPMPDETGRTTDA